MKVIGRGTCGLYEGNMEYEAENINQERNQWGED